MYSILLREPTFICKNSKSRRWLILPSPTGSVDMDKVHYCERFLELLVDLEVLINYAVFLESLVAQNEVLDWCETEM